MTEEDRKRLTEFEEKLHDFMYMQRELRAENQALKIQIKEKESQILGLHEEFRVLQEKYSRLRTAKTIDAAGDNLRDTKLRLSKMVREIDKCIALLNQ